MVPCTLASTLLPRHQVFQSLANATVVLTTAKSPSLWTGQTTPFLSATVAVSNRIFPHLFSSQSRNGEQPIVAAPPRLAELSAATEAIPPRRGRLRTHSPHQFLHHNSTN